MKSGDEEIEEVAPIAASHGRNNRSPLCLLFLILKLDGLEDTRFRSHIRWGGRLASESCDSRALPCSRVFVHDIVHYTYGLRYTSCGVAHG